MVLCSSDCLVTVKICTRESDLTDRVPSLPMFILSKAQRQKLKSVHCFQVPTCRKLSRSILGWAGNNLSRLSTDNSIQKTFFTLDTFEDHKYLIILIHPVKDTLDFKNSHLKHRFITQHRIVVTFSFNTILAKFYSQNRLKQIIDTLHISFLFLP